VVVRERLPHPKRESAFSLELLEDGERTEPAVLVVNGDDAAGVREPDSLTRGVHHLVVSRTHVGVAEMPGAFLPQDAGRLALVIALDDSAGNLEVAVGVREGGGVEPERVVVARHERGGDVARDGVQGFLRRLDGGRPVAAPPAKTPDPASFGNGPDRRADAGEGLVERTGSLQAELALSERPGWEMDVGVGESGEDTAAAEIDAIGAREGGLVRAHTAGHELTRDRERARLRQRGVERANDALLEDHASNPIGPGRRMGEGYG